MLTALVGIVVSLPLGVLLALGRRSQLPFVRAASVVFIEVVRGVPFITVLFMANNMLPLFLPPGVEPDRFLRPLVGIALFSAAYMAEEVRGGLQTLPRGQYEGAMALGLDYRRMMALVVLPQALTLVIPGIVNNFIGLFKDTTLVVDRRRQRFPRGAGPRDEGPGLGRGRRSSRPATRSPACFISFSATRCRAIPQRWSGGFLRGDGGDGPPWGGTHRLRQMRRRRLKRAASSCGLNRRGAMLRCVSVPSLELWNRERVTTR